MARQASLPSPTEKQRRPSSSFFSGFTKMGFSETEAAMSPTSILDSRPFSGFRNPFGSEPKTNDPHDHKRLWAHSDSKGILAVVDSLSDDHINPNSPKPDSRMVLFGSQLKIQIPTLLVSPADFGVKAGAFQSPAKNSGGGTPNSPVFFAGCLSVKEMELSEDYTRVISHGPNPRTTHIFDNCVIESCCGVLGLSPSKKEDGVYRSSFLSESFLSSCLTCKKHLGQGDDIYMYRGEKAFCSVECRSEEMTVEDGSLETDYDVYEDCSL